MLSTSSHPQWPNGWEPDATNCAIQRAPVGPLKLSDIISLCHLSKREGNNMVPIAGHEAGDPEASIAMLSHSSRARRAWFYVGSSHVLPESSLSTRGYCSSIPECACHCVPVGSETYQPSRQKWQRNTGTSSGETGAQRQISQLKNYCLWRYSDLEMIVGVPGTQHNFNLLWSYR